MSEHGKQAQVRIGIAAETLSYGSLRSYAIRLDEAMRAQAGDHLRIVTPRVPPVPRPSKQTTRPFKPSALRRALSGIGPLRRIANRVRSFIHPRWPDAKNWARKSGADA